MSTSNFEFKINAIKDILEPSKNGSLVEEVQESINVCAIVMMSLAATSFAIVAPNKQLFEGMMKDFALGMSKDIYVYSEKYIQQFEQIKEMFEKVKKENAALKSAPDKYPS